MAGLKLKFHAGFPAGLAACLAGHSHTGKVFLREFPLDVGMDQLMETGEFCCEAKDGLTLHIFVFSASDPTTINSFPTSEPW